MDNEIKEFVTTEAEAEELKDFIRSSGEEKGIDNFFLEVIRAENNLKIGNLDKEEIGLPQLPIRTLIELSNDCEIIPSMSSFAKDFKEQANTMIASSLSKDGFLVTARITQNKKLLNPSKKKTRRRGLFGKKEEEEDEQ